MYFFYLIGVVFMAIQMNHLEFLLPFKKLQVFMQIFKSKSPEYSLQQTVTSFFSNTPAPANAMDTLCADCAPATDLDLPPTLGYLVEGQSG